MEGEWRGSSSGWFQDKAAGRSLYRLKGMGVGGSRKSWMPRYPACVVCTTGEERLHADMLAEISLFQNRCGI